MWRVFNAESILNQLTANVYICTKSEHIMKQQHKICKSCGKERPLFSKGMCLYCWRKHNIQNVHVDHRNKPVEPLSHKSKGKMSLRTKKRSQEEYWYHKIVSEMNKKEKKVCIFCGKPMGRAEDHHHLIGRDGDLLTNKKYIKHAHRKCHAQYHNNSVWDIVWFLGFVKRVRKIDTKLADKELNKYNKL